MQARINLQTFSIFPSVYLGSYFYYKCVNQQLMNEVSIMWRIYDTKAEFNNCFIIHSWQVIPSLKTYGS